MKTVYADKHALHAPSQEIYCGQVMPCAEKPARGDNVHRAVRESGLGDILAPQNFSLADITRVHDAGYVDFLKTGYAAWKKAGFETDVFACNFNLRQACNTPPQVIEGKAGYYLADTSVSITQGTWEVLEQSAYAALTALDIVAGGDRAAFALCRPPGHHASVAAGGGYGLLNNAAIAAQAFIDKGLGKVAVLDVDYHHGNGTQDIFYHRNDLLYCSLHADPALDFPYFSGYADEKGAGAGEGFNRNYPLPMGTAWATYKESLADAARHIDAYGADILVVSLGVDTFKDDPISQFKLETDDYARIGAEIAKLGKPTLFVMEGGYAIDQIGVNVVKALTGFQGA